MKLEQRCVGDVTVIELSGEVIETEDQEAFRRTLADAVVHCGGRLVIDVKGVTYLCSAAIGAMVIAHRELDKRGSRLRLSGPGKRTLETLKTARLHTLFDICDTLEQAVASFENGE